VPSAIGSVLVLFALVVGVEIVFRGLVHGSLATAFRINRDGEPWRLSIPILMSSVLYASCIASQIGWAWPMLSGAWISPDYQAALPVAGGFLFGTATGLARERSESVAEPVMLHLVALVACLAFVPL
jgi:membrane protease YdiL (CAAX protease family)